MNKETLAEQYCESHNLNLLKPIVNAAYIDGYEAAQRWIPVYESLPKENDVVIVRNDSMHLIRCSAFFQEGKFLTDFISLSSEEVTHWLPIPSI